MTIDLNDGITAIVGPQSEVVEHRDVGCLVARAKSLRGGKMDDVIFAGTATRKPREWPKFLTCY